MEKNAWGPDEAVLMEKAGADPQAGEIGLRELVLLCWLNHVDANLTNPRHCTASRIWKAKNIASVLHQLPEGIGEEPSKTGQAPAGGAGAL